MFASSKRQLRLVKSASSLNNVLKTNNIPSDLEKTQLESLLSDAQTELATFKDSHATHKIPDFLGQLIFACKSALSTFRRLPPEVLLVIFSFTLPDMSQVRLLEHPREVMRVNSSPRILAQVSSRWRHIVTPYQPLWSHIFIQFGAPGSVPPSLVTLQLQLERSGSHPLDIYFRDDYDWSSDGAKKLIRLLISHSHRWRDICFFMKYDSLHLMEQVKGRTPILQTMHLGPLGGNRHGVIRAFEESPNLHQVIYTHESGDLCLPWSQLTHLRIPHIDFDILRQMANLLELDCKVIQGPVQDVYLPHLTRLRFSPERSRIERIRAPKLESLDVYGSAEPVFRLYGLERTDRAHLVDLDMLTLFIGRSGCVLLSLSVTELSLEHAAVESLGNFVASIPSLLRLELHRCEVNWDMLTDVIAPENAPCRLPGVRHVVFTLREYPEEPPYDSMPSLAIKELPELPYCVPYLLESLAGLPRDGAPSLVSAGLFNAKICAEDEWRISRLVQHGVKIFRDNSRRRRLVGASSPRRKIV
ncbi:hypothetical protein H0H81_007302 [Sphagnurus paluster]|uniref:F-box domain-containing protein n=1 Tax=Sphagnurus paluster TaxID=117069 RepID=A0A9P7K576_9AGAR|nr:hypothetical protein H0H81_007302 [Sphagnurus paluster]